MATSSRPGGTPPSSKINLVLVALLVAALLTILAGGYLLLTRAQPPAAAPAAPPPIFVALEPMTVNLHADGRGRFLHVSLTLKSADPASQERIAQYLPEVRSRVLTLLSNREAETLASAAGKAQLADEIVATVNRPFAAGLPEQRITHAMFTAFVLQ
ncbi:flagellar basal body-associated protein FliL [Ramlibacter tataouinensis]|uniref:flagellar basal body-associated protein FliL n=1 Tax=Ramlibacter tataouinensis TaxID=94132 RepID=UPI0022F3EFC1|nr:flagellar basal body-associated protein FliL [Ramlibacter tataouinensis]WBY00612.1 flagellar basal body-associated protein FliL [Ramlibacter tataouinensis]